MRRASIVLAILMAVSFAVAVPAFADYPPSVQPTTVAPPNDDVGDETVRPPSDVAFTGSSGVDRAVVIAGGLLLLGAGLLFLTRRRAVRRDT